MDSAFLAFSLVNDGDGDDFRAEIPRALLAWEKLQGAGWLTRRNPEHLDSCLDRLLEEKTWL